jgi:hypothetical protein
MRKNTPKQTKASRKNGSNGKGPTTPAGKKAVRFNALKDGLFTKEIVVELAGERREDFERLSREVWNFLKPKNTLEEMLVRDIIENRWRLLRVRRAESLDLQRRLGLIAIGNLSPSDQSPRETIQALQAKFFSCYEKFIFLRSSEERQMDGFDMGDQLEDVRRQLASASDGVEFLINQLKALQYEARSKGYISQERAILLLACAGFGDRVARLCYRLNQMLQPAATSTTSKSDSVKPTDEAKKRDEDIRLSRLMSLDEESFQEFEEEWKKAQRKNKSATATSKATAEDQSKEELESKQKVLVLQIGICITELQIRKTWLLGLEKARLEVQKAETIVDGNRSERFLRAETAIERRLYRALAMLVAIREAQSLPPSIPAASKQPPAQISKTKPENRRP